MTTLEGYEVHPFADVFPLMEGAEFDELVADIKKNGLNEPIVLSHDRAVLVDGRNRLRACRAAGVDEVYRALGKHYTATQVIDYIVSSNVARRHLDVGQRAFLGIAVEAAYAEIAKERQREAGRKNGARPVIDEPQSKLVADLRQAKPHEQKASAHAAKTVNVSPRAIQQAKAVKRDAPDLVAKVQSRQMSLDAADKERKRRIAAEPKPDLAKPARTTLTLYTHKGDPVPYPQPQGKAQFNRTAGEGISWAGWSWNPVTGCLHGCDYCYARELASKTSYQAAYPVGFTPLFHPERLDAPANTSVPQGVASDRSLGRVFVCSMADLYGQWVPDEWIQQVHASCAANPQWQYLLLTKFPSRYTKLDLPATAWVGTSVDEQKRVRIAEEAFKNINGVAVKWLSLEPLREPLEFTDLSMFDWVVIGAQTETRQPDKVVSAFAPPFEWVARIVTQAREAGCKVHLKPNLLGQVNGQLPGMALPDEYPEPVS